MLEEVIGEESGAGDESGLVAFDFDVASEEFDRYVGRCGGVIVSALRQ